jgi:catechol 2,3-dioxygenase-like lactoylglutathione lyase family enzyme
MFTDSKAYSGFAVPDLEAARMFYGETLGLRTSVPMEGVLLALHLAGDRDTLIYHKPDHEPANYTILNFEVDDVERAVDDLSSRGVRFQRYEGFDQDEKGISRGQGPTIAWFTDPAGNILAVHERMCSARPSVPAGANSGRRSGRVMMRGRPSAASCRPSRRARSRRARRPRSSGNGRPITARSRPAAARRRTAS